MKKAPSAKKHHAAEGFTLVEAVFAILILTVGMVALLGLFAQAVAAVGYSSEDQITKQKARESLEAVYSARNDTSITWSAIQNVSSGGIFKDGFQPLFLPGANGIPGTVQDTSTLDRFILPGPDGILGTADDVVVPLINYQRQILIQPVNNPDGSVNPDLRQLSVTVQVNSPGRGLRVYTVSGFISRFV
jgi:type II secretory pathway pseudopilin PulG